METQRNKLLVISMDALGAMDAPYFKELPGFKRFLQKASYCFNVSSVYPSITYPAHTSIVTGCYPKKHGIVNNLRRQFGRPNPDWFWQRKYIRTTTFYDEALAAGMTVASFLWPVTAKSKITWNMPEIFANRPWSNQILTSLNNGSPLFQAAMQKYFGHIRQGRTQPALDNFVMECLKLTLEKKQPDVTLVHLTDLDSQRHLYGTRSPQARDAIVRHDARLRGIFEILERAGLYDRTNLIVLGDHYQKDTTKAIHVNYWFMQKGWITLRGNNIHQWQAYCQNCDGSAYVYIRKGCGHIRDEVRELLDTLAADSDSGIEQVIGGKDAAAMGADPHCSFMLEARDGYYFQDSLNGPERAVVFPEGVPDGEKLPDPASLPMHATHGYFPGKPGYQTVFMAAGPDIREHVEIPSMCLVDEGPTMAKLLGLTLPAADGRILTSILKE